MTPSQPRRPSWPMPVRITARTPAPKVAVAERSSGSTEGRQEFSGGSTVSAVTMPPPADRRTSRCEPPGAIHTPPARTGSPCVARSEEHTSELQSLMRISYAVFCLKKKKYVKDIHNEIPVMHLIEISTNLITSKVSEHTS